MRFDFAEFLGLKREYDEFMHSTSYNHPGYLTDDCANAGLEFMVAGGRCGKRADT